MSFKFLLRFRSGFPDRVHVEQIHEEIVGQGFGTAGKHTVFGMIKVGFQHTHTAHQDGHFRGG